MTLTATSFATVPYLARVLGPQTWGLLVLAQACNAALVILIEYGFTMTGARAVAQGQLELRSGGGRIAGIYAARCVLAIVAILIGLFFLLLIPAFQSNSSYLALAVVWAVFSGFGPWWYFLAKGELTRPAALAITTRLAATAAIFLVVREPRDGWLVLVAYGLASLVDTMMMTLWIMREIGFGAAPTLSEITDLLREGGPVFAQQAGGGIFGAAGTLVLGGVASPEQVAFFGGGEKIARLGRQLLTTVSRVIFPRMSALEIENPEKADRSRTQLLRLGVALGMVAAAMGFLLARPVVTLVLGPGYEQAVPVLRTLLFAFPFMAATDVLGTQGLLARGKDRVFAGVALGIAGTGLCLSGVLAFFFAHRGMAAGTTMTEILMALAMALVWRRS